MLPDLASVMSSSLTKPEENLAWRIKELSSLMAEQDQVVADACGVLDNASKSLASVRSKFEPVKDNAAALSTTSANAGAISQDLHKLITSSQMHQKVLSALALCSACFQLATASVDTSVTLRSV